MDKKYDYSGKKAVFFDIDGTLYDRTDKRQVPESTKNAIRLLQENGHLAIICTGRCDCAVEETFRKLEFDGYIFGCGTNIVFKNEELYYQKMQEEKVERMIEFCKEYSTIPVLEGKYSLYISDDTSLDGGECYRFYSNLFKGKINPITKRPLEVSKLMARIVDRTPEKVTQFYEQLGNEMDIFDHGVGLELVPKGFSKASGIERLIKMLGIKREDTYAFGDSQNDLSMLSYVGTGIAMGNGQKEIFEVCDFKTDCLYDDGIYNACKKLGLI